MLYSGQGSSDLVRVHGAFMSDDEVARVADDWRARGKPNYIDGILDGADDEDSGENQLQVVAILMHYLMTSLSLS